MTTNFYEQLRTIDISNEDHNYTLDAFLSNKTTSVVIPDPVFPKSDVHQSASVDEQITIDTDVDSEVDAVINHCSNLSSLLPTLPSDQWALLASVSTYQQPPHHTCSQACDPRQQLASTAVRPVQNWIVCEKFIQRAIRVCVERAYFQIYSIEVNRMLPSSVGAHISRLTAFHFEQCRKIARCARKSFARLYWSTERCFSLHHWCITNLKPELVALYTTAYLLLKQHSKLTSLLTRIDALMGQRDPQLASAFNHCLIQLGELNPLLGGGGGGDGQSQLPLTGKSSRPGGSRAFNSGLSSDQSTTSSLLLRQSPTTLPSILGRNRQLANYSSAGGSSNDDTVFACLTIPYARGHPGSRINAMLRDLGKLGRVNVETGEEVGCDQLDRRLRLFTMRVAHILDETHRVNYLYLVGFGPTSNMMILAVTDRLLSLHASRQDRRHEPRTRLPTLTGLILLGGSSGDHQLPPLVNGSRLPVLAVTRLGVHSSSSANSIVEASVAGVDRLLRMPSRWCRSLRLTRGQIDARIMTTIRRFVTATNAKLRHHSKVASTSSLIKQPSSSSLVTSGVVPSNSSSLLISGGSRSQASSTTPTSSMAGLARLLQPSSSTFYTKH